MRVGILGVGGTFMAGIAVLARALGHEVWGMDANIYPPMSDQLTALGIRYHEGYDAAALPKDLDQVVIGNALSRGQPVVEAVLNQRLPYFSGPEWLAQQLLRDRWVLAVSGTHGKTTTSSMLAWILTYAGLNPGFLIGGIPGNFETSAELGASPFFVIEADEYDTAFFDKRSKFLHYRPSTLIINNVEFDHADIFASLEDIEWQFQQLVRTVPGYGAIVAPANDPSVQRILAAGCWSEAITLGSLSRAGEQHNSQATWSTKPLSADGRHFAVYKHGECMGEVEWPLLGQHNMANALAAIAAAEHAGVPAKVSILGLQRFVNAKRRLELLDTVRGVSVYDDFAHHPTAIATTLEGLRAHVGQDARIIAVLEFGSNTMKQGVHNDAMAKATLAANQVFYADPHTPQIDLAAIIKASEGRATVYADNAAIIDALKQTAKAGDHIVIMSNKGFGGLHKDVLKALVEP